MAYMFEQAVLLLVEIGCWSLFELKGLIPDLSMGRSTFIYVDKLLILIYTNAIQS